MKRLLATHELTLQMALLSIVLGLLCGIGAVIFRGMIGLIHNIAFLGEFSLQYDANAHTAAGPWGAWVILVPVIGGMLVVYIVKRFAPEAKGHGVPEVIDAIHYKRSVIRPIVALAKAIASAITIGTGGAVGREGPIIQIGSAMGSSMGQWLRLPEWQRSTLIGGGAAAGIAATFNTPVGGLLFAVELLLPETSARTLIPVILAAGAGTLVGELAFGNVPSFDVTPLASSTELPMIGDYFAFILFGLLLGVASTLYIKAIYKSEDLFSRIPVNDYGRHAIGMVLVGLVMYAFMTQTGHYYIQGVGYATIQDILSGVLTNPWLLVLLFGAKLFATSLTLGSGGSGGVFSPGLFLGATLGAAFGVAISTYVPGFSHLEVSSMAMIGMAGIFGGSTGAVVTAIVMIFEMTRDYHVILPLMIVVSIAYGVRRHFLRDSLYTHKLTRRGHYIPDSIQSNLCMLRQVSDLLETPVLRADDSIAFADLREIARQNGHIPHLLVTGKNGGIKGVLSMERHKRHGTDDEFYIQENIDTNYITVKEDDLVFDVVTQLRAAAADIALVSYDGKVKNAGDVLGIVSLNNIAKSSSLTAHILRRQSLRAKFKQ
ncbi:MAG: chloride channel protein [Gammaproteobacteria bacterium]|nr:chloride channel protein [Gammaproteobacteria bacterium]